MTPNGLPIISRWREQGIGFLPSVDIYGWDKQGSAGGAKKRTICKMSHQHSTALPDIRRHIFSSVGQIQMFRNEQKSPFADAQLQNKTLFKQNNLKGESPCLRINSYGMKLLKACWGWQRIFCGFVHHEFSHKHVIVADLISRLEKKRIFQKWSWQKISSRRLKLESPKWSASIPNARTPEHLWYQTLFSTGRQ